MSTGVTPHVPAGRLQLTGRKQAHHPRVQPPQFLAARTDEGGKERENRGTGATTMMGGEER